MSAPTEVILVCGGEDPQTLPSQIKSFRDAFLRARYTSKLSSYSARLAEEVVPFFPEGNYRDILNFEADIAQICELVILFPESPGSFAELGAFAMEPEIAARMLAVVTRWFYDQRSFIKLGPIQSLENACGRSAVCVLEDQALNIPRNGSATNLDLPGFRTAMVAAITERLQTAREPTTFNANRNGHVIKLITGLIQHYGAMTLDEIDTSLFCLNLNVSRENIRNYLLCAKFVEWISEIPIGIHTYFAARNVNPALSYRFSKESGLTEPSRLRTDVREYWKLQRPERFGCITSAMGN